MKTLLLDFFGKMSSPKHLLFGIFLIIAGSVSAQNFTTIAAGDWNDPATWQGGRVPSNDLRNATVAINHDVVFSNTDLNIILRNNAELIVTGATLDIQSNLNVRSRSVVRASYAKIIIGPGLLNNDGQVYLSNSLLEKDGNIVNNNLIDLDRSCITLLSGNFNNNVNLTGEGGIKVLGGNAKNSGTWEAGIIYFAVNGGDNIPGEQSTEEQVEAACPCAISTVEVAVADQETCAAGSGDPGAPNSGDATFTAVISSGDPNDYNFQWYLNDQAITGANSSSYTVNGATQADNGGVYKVVITNKEAGCTAEGSATLKVNDCNIEYATPFVLLHDGKLSNALFILGRDGYNPNNTYNDFIYKIRIDGGVPKVLVQIVVASGQFNNLLGQLSSIGVQSGDFLQDYDINNPQAYVSCYVPIENLLVLDTSDFLIQVLDGKLGFTNTGTVVSEGVAAMRANIARLGWGVTGDGVTIGVISDSFDNNNGYTSDQIGRNLPGPSNPDSDKKTPVDVLEDLDGGGSDEGRAMLQLIHDVAPGASLKFATGFNGKYNAASQIEALRLAGCDIIVDDVQYIDEAFYEDDVWAQAVNNSVDAGVPVFTAAGNFGNKSIEQTFTPADAPFETFHKWANGATGQTLNLAPGFYIISVQWDDDYISLGEGTGAKVDLNAYLGQSPDILDFGSNVVNFNKDPMDFLYFLVLNPTTTNLYVERSAGSATGPLKFKYVVFRSGDTDDFNAIPAVGGSTIVGHANADKNFTVGAVRYDKVDPTPIPQTSSSDGGTTTGGAVRNKPDAMGPTGGDTTVPIGPDFDGDGQPNFFGTSAAAPHVAAVAAMIMEAGTKFGVPLTGTNTVRNLLLSTAVDMGTPLKNGAGFVRADLALGAIANPVPSLISLNFDQWLADNPGFVPGDSEFTAFYVGQNFTEESVVFFQGQQLPTTFVSSDTLSVTVPQFEGNGDGYVFTPPGPLTNGSDGGESETVGFFDTPAKNIIIRPADITRFYGTSVNPTDNPELFSFTVVDAETGVALPQDELDLFYDQTRFPVTYSTTDAVDSPTSVTFSVILNVDLANVDPGILELYNFDTDGSDDNGEIQAGNLFIEPTHVEISVEYPETLVYGEAFPGIDYVFNYVDGNGDPVPVVQSEKDKYELAHRNAFRLVNSLVVIANGRFRLVNDGTTNRFRLVNCEDPDPEVNRFRLVNGECEPEIVFDETLPDGTANRFRLVNQTFYISQSVVDESTSLANRFRLVNGDGSDQPWDADTKIIEIDPDLFANANRFRLVNGRNLTNLFRLVNDNEYDFLQDDGTTNRFRLVNGVGFSEGAAYYDGELVNRFRLVNGRSFRLVNEGGTNSFRLVNSDTSQPDPYSADAQNSVVLFNSSEGSEVVGSDPIEVFPVNFITGKDVGIQYVGTGRVFNNNFVATSTPVPVEILPASLQVTTENFPAEGEDPVVYGDYGAAVQAGEVQPDFQFTATGLQYDETPEEVLAGITLKVCPDCTDGKYPAGSYDILADFNTLTSEAASNYIITQSATRGQFTVNPFALKATAGDGSIIYGSSGSVDFGISLSLPDDTPLEEAALPYGESLAELFGANYSFTPADGCNLGDPLTEGGNVYATSIVPQTGFINLNYQITALSGEVTVEKAPLDLSVTGTKWINQGDAAPTDFQVEVAPGSLLCAADPDPTGLTGFTFQFYQDGVAVTARPLPAGTYQVGIDESALPAGYENYVGNTVEFGTLYVNPSLGCNDRIRLSDICKTDLGNGQVRLCFTYENMTPYDIYIPYGSRENQFKGRANIVSGESEVPSLFPANTTGQICVITNGDNLQWEVITPGCNNASKSPNGSNANPCPVNLEASIDLDAQVLGIEEVQSMAYPNPATDYVNLSVGDQEGQIDVQVFDTSGRMLISKDYGVTGLSEIQLDISALNPGFYFVKVGKADPIQIIKQ